MMDGTDTQVSVDTIRELPESPREDLEPALPSSRREWTVLMARLGIRPNKGLGQNFLFERGIVQRMVRTAKIGKDDLVVEVGPGLGILTDELLIRAGEVTAIELDRTLAAHVRSQFGSRAGFKLVEADALRVDLDNVVPPDRAYKVAANLPYGIAAAVIRRLLEARHPPTQLTVMLQREVAERLAATPPDMTILGVATQFYAEPRIAFLVPPTVFIPPPKVESAIAVLDVRSEPPLPAADHPLFFRIVNAGFRQKRKQIANSIAAQLDLPKAEVSAWLGTAGIDPMRRAQTLSVADWVRLTKVAPDAIRDGQ